MGPNTYASWAGKRLPTESEWQYAAQEGDGREFPWHGGMRTGVCNLGETGDTTPVKAFPAGRSGLGIYDLCGNVWQWTETESTEGRTRFVMIRGGSYFSAQKSSWYVDGGPRALNFTTKFLLMWPGLDRCGTVGFRCVVDLVKPDKCRCGQRGEPAFSTPSGIDRGRAAKAVCNQAEAGLIWAVAIND